MSAPARILVVGGTGPTGPHVVQGLLQRGHTVTLFHRGTHESDEIPPCVEHVHGDPHFAESIKESLGPREFDIVVAMYGRTRLLANHFAGRVGRFIAVGGMVAYLGHDAPTGKFPSGMTVPTPESDALVRHESEARFGWLVSETERQVLALHRDATILRYPLVYGPRQVLPREWCLVRRALDRRPHVILPDGGLSIIMRGHSANLAHALLCAVDKPQVAAGQVYNCGDDSQFTLRQLAEIVARAVGHQWEMISMPLGQAYPTWPMFNPDEAGWHRLLDTTRIRAELGYRDQVSPLEAMTETVRWYAERRAQLAPAIEERLGDPFDYDAEDRLVRDWQRCMGELTAHHSRPVMPRPHPYPHPKVAGLGRDHRSR